MHDGPFISDGSGRVIGLSGQGHDSARSVGSVVLRIAGVRVGGRGDDRCGEKHERGEGELGGDRAGGDRPDGCGGGADGAAAGVDPAEQVGWAWVRKRLAVVTVQRPTATPKVHRFAADALVLRGRSC